jgi:hypothetical protein
MRREGCEARRRRSILIGETGVADEFRPCIVRRQQALQTEAVTFPL